MREGGQCFLLMGAPVPQILRRVEGRDQLVGGCYVYDRMYGKGVHPQMGFDSTTYPGSRPGSDWQSSKHHDESVVWLTSPVTFTEVPVDSLEGLHVMTGQYISRIDLIGSYCGGILIHNPEGPFSCSYCSSEEDMEDSVDSGEDAHDSNASDAMDLTLETLDDIIEATDKCSIEDLIRESIEDLNFLKHENSCFLRH